MGTRLTAWQEVARSLSQAGSLRARTLPSPQSDLPSQAGPVPEPQLDPCAPGALTAHCVCLLFLGTSCFQRDHATRVFRIFPESLLPRVHGGAELILAFPGWELGGAQMGAEPMEIRPQEGG